MENLLTSPPSAPPPAAPAKDGRIVKSQVTTEQPSRTFMCAVLGLDLVEFFRKSVTDQLQAKERLHGAVSSAIADIPREERIVLDTGDGMAISFLGHAEDALLVAVRVTRALISVGRNEPALAVRMGLNHGPVRLTRDGNEQPSIIGDGIHVAQRVTHFANSAQVLASKSYYENVTRTAEEYATLFTFKGTRTDKHVREHEIYELASPSAPNFELAVQRLEQRALRRTARQTHSTVSKWASSRLLALAAMTVSIALLAGAVLVTGRDKTAVPAAEQATLPSASVASPAPIEIPAAPVVIEPEEDVALLGPTLAARPETTSAAPHAPAPQPRASKEPKSKNTGPFAPVAALEPAPSREPALPAVEIKREPPVETVQPQAAVPAPAPAAPAPTAPQTTHRATSGPTALVTLAISPWGEVFVDGKAVGVSPPLSELELAPGRHQILVRNGSMKPHKEDLDLGPNETTRIKHKFIQGR